MGEVAGQKLGEHSHKTPVPHFLCMHKMHVIRR